mmetsp:Transcript_29397/g.85686  ORF Transcript_29397/g.85686 Transcript_29397/m.85686 type:complete len:338 (-) Transcript_29397:1651-2664(-)
MWTCTPRSWRRRGGRGKLNSKPASARGSSWAILSSGWQAGGDPSSLLGDVSPCPGRFPFAPDRGSSCSKACCLSFRTSWMPRTVNISSTTLGSGYTTAVWSRSTRLEARGSWNPGGVKRCAPWCFWARASSGAAMKLGRPGDAAWRARSRVRQKAAPKTPRYSPRLGSPPGVTARDTPSRNSRPKAHVGHASPTPSPAKRSWWPMSRVGTAGAAAVAATAALAATGGVSSLTTGSSSSSRGATSKGENSHHSQASAPATRRVSRNLSLFQHPSQIRTGGPSGGGGVSAPPWSAPLAERTSQAWLGKASSAACWTGTRWVEHLLQTRRPQHRQWCLRE